MKTTKFMLTLVVIFTMIACSNDNKFFPYAEEEKSSNIVNAQEAQNVAYFYLFKNGNVPNTRSRQANGGLIESSFSINDEDSNPIMHIINYEGGGFTIVSGDNRIEPILAYSDNGSFEENEVEEEYPEGLQVWIKEIRKTIKYIRDNHVTAPEELLNHWNICAESGKSRAIPNVGFSCNETGEVLESQIVNPLLTTTWSQQSSFDDDMPLITCNGISRNAYVGCVPLAVAQIMKFWEFPTGSGYNWNSMPNSYATSATRDLISEIHNKIEIYYNINYDCEGTGIPNVSRINDVFKIQFGYSTALYASYDADVVKNEILTYRRPVLLSGTSSDSGHAWVCDGAHEWTACIKSDNGDYTVTYLQFHMNWGWGGLYDGWYGYAGFTIPQEGVEYDENLQMIYNIKP